MSITNGIFEASSKAVAIMHPVSALRFYLGQKDPMQRAVIKNAARYLWGNAISTQEWDLALDEIQQNDLIQPALNTANIPVGNSLGNT